MFDANCPEFFAPNERQDYESFLQDVPEAYEVCIFDGRLLGAFGLLTNGKNEKRINWILIDTDTQGLGIGSKIMERAIHLARTSNTKTVNIAASQKSAPFFARFGAIVTATTKDGWGSGMDRVDMVLVL